MRPTLILGLLFMLASPGVNACKVVQLSLAERIEASSAIYLGRITDVIVSANEPNGADEAYETNDPGYSSSRYVNRTVSMIVYETLVGASALEREFELHWCGGNAMAAELGADIVAYQSESGHWYIEVGKDAILDVRSQLTSDEP